MTRHLDRPHFPRLGRRDFLLAGGVSVAGYSLLPMLDPLHVSAARKAEPRGTADFVIFLFLEGGASQVDTFDLKEGKWTPPDFAPQTIAPDLTMPMGLMPRLAKMHGDYALVRSCAAWESAHARAQYYIQVGHVFSPARIKEMPSIGSVVAYEWRAKRKPSDFLPPFVAVNYGSAQAGLVGSGMLAATYSPMAIFTKGDLPFIVPDAEREAFARRKSLLARLDSALRSGESRGREMKDYGDFYETSYRILDAPQASSIFKVEEADHKRYGGSEFGNGCVIARNLVEADAGTRFIAVCQPGWDLHGNAYDKTAKGNQYKLCWDLDAALSNLLTDLQKRTNKVSGRPLIERTLVVAMGEFGRTPGELTINKGRDHHRYAATALFAGAGVRGGRILGATDAMGMKVADPGWHARRPVYPEDVMSTVYSAMGIDWTKKMTETPSGRPFYYIENLAPTGPMLFDEITELFA